MIPVHDLVRRALGPSSFSEIRVAARLLRATDGVMVDVGAHHGGSLAAFAKRGWTVHAFEPDRSNRRVLMEGLGRLHNVHVDPRAVSETSGLEVAFFTSPVSSGISSLSPFHPSHVQEDSVTTIALRDYLQESGLDRIDLLKTDCEGHDLFVLRGLDWDTHHPRVVVCEFEDRKTASLGYTHGDLARFLEDAGYTVLVSEWASIVEYGEEHQWLRVTPWPTQVGATAWGNLIAVADGDRARAIRAVRTVAAQLKLRRAADKLRRR